MRTLGFLGVSQSSSENCDNLVLICMDFRFHKRLSDVLSYAGYAEFDILALPGSSKAVRDNGSREVVFDTIQTALAAHSIKRFIIIDHIDCKAYGGSEIFSSPEEEIAAHKKALQEAGQIVREKFPQLEIVLLYADWNYLNVIEQETAVV